MKKIVLLAVLALVLVAVPAFASVQNVKVSGEIDSTWVYRNQFDLGLNTGSYTGSNTQNFFMTQTLLRVDADLTDKVGTTIRLINERAWDQEDSDSNVDLNLAYVTIKEMLYSPLTVVVGRQAFAFGNSFVIDSEGPNNIVTAGGLDGIASDLSKRRAMDAVRAILDYNPMTIDLVFAKIDANNLDTVGEQKDDVTLMGTNVNYKLGDKNDTVLEGYFWVKTDNSKQGNGELGAKADEVFMPGIRAQISVLDGLTTSIEGAIQRGNYYNTSVNRNEKRDAYGVQMVSSYKLPFEKTKAYSPVLMMANTIVSGEQNPTTYAEHYTAWDPMFENQGSGKIYNTLFNLSDAQIITLRGSFNPIEDVTASVEYNNIQLQKKYTASAFPLYQPDISGSSSPNYITPIQNDNDKPQQLGDEVDLGLSYAYTEDVTIGATLGWFKAGKAFSNVNRKDASQAMVNVDVKF